MSIDKEVQYVPVIDKNNEPLMPCHPARARQLLRKGKAVRRWFRGVFAIKLTERAGGVTQPIAAGVDPGSKREGFTVKSESHTLLNVQTHAVDWVKSAVETRRNLRRARRQRNTPYRECRWNRSSLRKNGRIAPSTKARWQWKLRIIRWLKRLYPLTDIVVEDIAAVTKPGKKKWNKSFSPLEVGKRWFYGECEKLGNLTTFTGVETSGSRKSLELAKSSKKLGNEFTCHCVDSWVLANSIVGGHVKPDLTKLLEVIPIRLHRRQLHKQNFEKGGIRKSYGGTRSLGFERGSLVKHAKRGLCYIGGTSNGRVSLHDISTGKRLTQLAKIADINFLTYLPWRWHSPLS